MSEWWTYRPSDFLMFSARAYARLVELYNADLWPLQLPVLALGSGLLWAVARRHQAAAPAGAALAALAWAGVGFAFVWQRFAQINTGATYLAMAFALQAGLLAWWALARWRHPPRRPSPGAAMHRLGCGVFAAALLLYPWLPLLAGRPLAQAEVAGLMPQPTALATLGWLLAVGAPRHLAVVVLLVLAVGATTSWLLHGAG